ncbi:hypothetical protein IE53DRAFT_206967 [Violaceomyces palustris]|uniref:Uncharacterized protein n=1 Tax=Violaceomyces palustris TaxID=1673888 RepID=A0ACD0NQW9_9BASI|nr:hypothetical protein IE53DRAFT_206967 [Violaceomyces palustris]
MGLCRWDRCGIWGDLKVRLDCSTSNMCSWKPVGLQRSILLWDDLDLLMLACYNWKWIHERGKLMGGGNGKKRKRKIREGRGGRRLRVGRNRDKLLLVYMREDGWWKRTRTF